MKTSRLIPWMLLIVGLSVSPSFAQQKVTLGENAALRYWAAFAQMQDSGITDQEARELNTILAGTSPYDDLKYKDLVEKNRPALETMARAASLPNCNWGLDYGQGTETPVDYVRRALPLGRLNVLYTFHLLIVGDKDGAVRTLASGLRFSRDLANGGSLFATVIAKALMVNHLRAVDSALHMGALSSVQRSALQKAVAGLGPEPLNWQSAMKREMAVLNRPPWQNSVPLGRVSETYAAALGDSSLLPKLEQLIAGIPKPLREVIPNPKEVLEEKRDLNDKLQQTRLSFQ
jgi:hypothetical protein